VCDTSLDLGLDLLDGPASLPAKSLVTRADDPGGEPRVDTDVLSRLAVGGG
jgi:hypothetical protein